MKRTVLTFGLIAGAGMALLQWIIYPLCYRGYITFDNSTYLGYAGMLIVFSMIFFGIKSYRDNQGGGSVTFWKAFQIGILITLLASLIHGVGGWAYNLVNPDFKRFFLEKFTEHELNKLPQPVDAAAKQAIDQQVEMVRSIYENPVLDLLFSVMLILPAGLIVTVISALLLRRKDLLPGTPANDGP